MYIAWTPINWITVVLMAAAGFALLSLASQLWHNRSGS